MRMWTKQNFGVAPWEIALGAAFLALMAFAGSALGHFMWGPIP